MTVVSLSIPDELLADMDEARNQRADVGRSAFIRAALRTYLQDASKPTGHVHGSITIAYAHGHEADVSKIRHEYHDVVLSLMHTHCEPQVCMDVLLVGGQANRIVELHGALQRLRHVTRAVFVPIMSHATTMADANGDVP